jgi:hypothetical protein
VNSFGVQDGRQTGGERRSKYKVITSTECNKTGSIPAELKRKGEQAAECGKKKNRENKTQKCKRRSVCGRK